MDKIKSNIFPALVSIIAMFIWRDVTELKTDVKELLAQSNIDKTKIENLERIMYDKKTPIASVLNPIFYDKLFKHEDFYDIKKHLPQLNS